MAAGAVTDQVTATVAVGLQRSAEPTEAGFVDHSPTLAEAVPFNPTRQVSDELPLLVAQDVRR